jgi:hypothetical protein
MRKCLYGIAFVFGAFSVAQASETMIMKQPSWYDQTYKKDSITSEQQNFWETEEFQKRVEQRKIELDKLEQDEFLRQKVSSLTNGDSNVDTQKTTFQAIFDYMDENGYNKDDLCLLIYAQYDMNTDAEFDKAAKVVDKWYDFLEKKTKKTEE